MPHMPTRNYPLRSCLRCAEMFRPSGNRQVFCCRAHRIGPCLTCGVSFDPTRTGQRYCSTTCAGAAKRVPVERQKHRYESFVLPHDCAIGKRDVIVPLHRWVLLDKIGPGPHACHWCAKPLTWTGRPDHITADHLDRNTHNNRPENLVPACHGCNVWRQHPDRIKDGELFVVNGSGRARAVERVCPCGRRFLFIPSDKRPHVGRFCSRSCARRRHS